MEMMAALAVATPTAPVSYDLNALPELSDVDYFDIVLQLPNHKTEEHFDDELDARATSLGIEVPRQITSDKRNTSSTLSASTATTNYHARTFSTASNGSGSTALTSPSSIFRPRTPDDPNAVKRVSKHLNFAQYDKYLSQLNPNLDQPKIRRPSVPEPQLAAPSLFSVRTKRSFLSVKSGIRRTMRWGKKPPAHYEPPMSCVCCRDDFDKSASLYNLPCGHQYCAKCLKVVVEQATTDESRMPPRCCTQPIPGSIVKALLDRDGQQAFLKSVVQFSTPWESRIFCPKAACGEFIPPRGKVNPKHPFTVTCRTCQTGACVMCKREAHPVGKDCPEDWELEAVLKMGEKSGWRRCYKCKNLVELAQGCTHVTCRCKAQFCYICGGVWDPEVGCPNVCMGEEELERRRLEEEERLVQLEADKAARSEEEALEAKEREAAEARSREHPAFQNLQRQQEHELDRFAEFTTEARSAMQQRHLDQKLALLDKHTESLEKMNERHNRTAGHLEDRQVAAEMELRATLDQSERSVRVRLKHMEAYCDGLGRAPDSKMPGRTVTERDLRELGQQYNLRDNMERLHQAKINVMRDRQTKQMEELLMRQEAEMRKLTSKKHEELEDLGMRFNHEEECLTSVFGSRQARLKRRWELAMDVLRKEVEAEEKTSFALLPTPEFPEAAEETAISEEEGITAQADIFITTDANMSI